MIKTKLLENKGQENRMKGATKGQRNRKKQGRRREYSNKEKTENTKQSWRWRHRWTLSVFAVCTFTRKLRRTEQSLILATWSVQLHVATWWLFTFKETKVPELHTPLNVNQHSSCWSASSITACSLLPSQFYCQKLLTACYMFWLSHLSFKRVKPEDILLRIRRSQIRFLTQRSTVLFCGVPKFHQGTDVVENEQIKTDECRNRRTWDCYRKATERNQYRLNATSLLCLSSMSRRSSWSPSTWRRQGGELIWRGVGTNWNSWLGKGVAIVNMLLRLVCVYWDDQAVCQQKLRGLKAGISEKREAVRQVIGLGLVETSSQKSEDSEPR